MKKLENVFEKYGLDKNSAKLKNLTISDKYDWEDRKKIFLGFEVVRKYEVHFNKMKKLKDFLYEVHQAGANYIDDVRFSRSDYEKLDIELIGKAIDDASAKAKIISKKLNLKLDGADVISDEPPSEYSYQNRVDFDFPKFGKKGIGDMLGGLLGGSSGRMRKHMKNFFDIDPGKIKMDKEIWVTFKTK